MELKFHIDNLNIERLDNYEVVEGSENLVKVYFTFNGDMWLKGEKTAVFTATKGFKATTESAFGIPLVDNSCYIPADILLSDQFSVGVMTTYEDNNNNNNNTVIVYSKPYLVSVKNSCRPSSSDGEVNLSAISQYEYIMNLIKEYVDNHSGFLDMSILESYHDPTKQDILISGENIKTLNNESILGEGNISIPKKVSELENDSGYINEHQDISGKEDTINKVTSVSSTSTDTEYPSAKCVYDLIGDLETLLGGI